MSSNSSNYGLPVILFALGETGLARAALYVSVNALLRSSLGVYLAARGSIPSPVSALRRVFSVPVVYAAILGLVLNLSHIALPEPVIKAAHILGQGLVPASLVVLGAQIVETFRKQSQIHNRPALTLAVFVKLIIAPVIAIVVTFLLGLKGLTQKVVILETATPSAVLSLVLATEFHTDEAFAALTVLVTTLVSFVTVALWLHFVIMR
jgi:predicted permease